MLVTLVPFRAIPQACAIAADLTQAPLHSLRRIKASAVAAAPMGCDPPPEFKTHPVPSRLLPRIMAVRCDLAAAGMRHAPQRLHVPLPPVVLVEECVQVVAVVVALAMEAVALGLGEAAS